MSRKVTPDILGALMGEIEKRESSIVVEQDDNKAIKPASNKAVSLEGNKTIKQASSVVEPSSLKEKATFNLSKSVLADLEDSWIEIRKLRGDKRISKTDIVERAIEGAIKEFRLKKELSEFYGKLERNKAIKQ